MSKSYFEKINLNVFKEINSLLDSAYKKTAKGKSFIETLTLQFTVIDLFLKFAIIKKLNENNNNKAQKHLEKDLMFGQLIKIADIVGFDHKIITDLNKYNEKRINLVHKLLTTYKNLNQANIDAKNNVKLGMKILVNLMIYMNLKLFSKEEQKELKRLAKDFKKEKND